MLTYYDDEVSAELSERVARSTAIFDAERIDGGWYLRPTEEPVRLGSTETEQIEDEIGPRYEY